MKKKETKSEMNEERRKIRGLCRLNNGAKDLERLFNFGFGIWERKRW
jgi:hypothetical protein